MPKPKSKRYFYKVNSRMILMIMGLIWTSSFDLRLDLGFLFVNLAQVVVVGAATRQVRPIESCWFWNQIHPILPIQHPRHLEPTWIDPMLKPGFLGGYWILCRERSIYICAGLTKQWSNSKRHGASNLPQVKSQLAIFYLLGFTLQNYSFVLQKGKNSKPASLGA